MYSRGHSLKCCLVLRGNVYMVVAWLTVFAWMLPLSTVNTLWRASLVCTCMCIPRWSVLYESVFVEWFTILFYRHSAGYAVIIWPPSWFKKRSFLFPFLSSWLPSSRKGNPGKPCDNPFICLSRDWQGIGLDCSLNLRFSGCPRMSMSYSVSGSITDRPLALFHWNEFIP